MTTNEVAYQVKIVKVF